MAVKPAFADEAAAPGKVRPSFSNGSGVHPAFPEPTKLAKTAGAVAGGLLAGGAAVALAPIELSAGLPAAALGIGGAALNAAFGAKAGWDFPTDHRGGLGDLAQLGVFMIPEARLLGEAGSFGSGALRGAVRGAAAAGVQTAIDRRTGELPGRLLGYALPGAALEGGMGALHGAVSKVQETVGDAAAVARRAPMSVAQASEALPADATRGVNVAATEASDLSARAARTNALINTDVESLLPTFEPHAEPGAISFTGNAYDATPTDDAAEFVKGGARAAHREALHDIYANPDNPLDQVYRPEGHSWDGGKTPARSVLAANNNVVAGINLTDEMHNIALEAGRQGAHRAAKAHFQSISGDLEASRAIEDRAAWEATGHPLVRAGKKAWHTLMDEVYTGKIQDIASALGKHKAMFGSFGDALGQGMKQVSRLRSLVTGDWMDIVNNQILKDLSPREMGALDAFLHHDHQSVGRYKDALGEAGWAKIMERASIYRELTGHIHVERVRAGVRQIDSHFGRVLANIGPRDAEAVMNALHNGGTAGREDLDLIVSAIRRRDEGWRIEKNNRRYGWDPAANKDVYAVVGPPAELKGHAHYMLDEAKKAEALKPGTELNRRMLEDMSAQAGYRVNQQDLEEHFGAMAGHSDELRGGGIQHTRKLVGGDMVHELRQRDPRIWMGREVQKAADRLASAHVWGAQDEKGLAIIAAMRNAGLADGAKLADQAFTASIKGLAPTSPLMKGLQNFMMFKMLGPSTALLQVSQLSNQAVYQGLRRTTRAIVAAATDPALRAEVARSGAVLMDAPHIVGVDAISNLTHYWLKLTGVVGADTFARYANAVGGVMHAEDLAGVLLKELEGGKAWLQDGQLVANSPSSRRAAQMLKETYGLRPEELVQAGGKLNQEQRMVAMQQAVHNMQFESNVEDLPFGRLDPKTRWLYMFRSWGLQQGRFWDEAVIKPWRAGDRALALKRLSVGMASFGMLAVPAESIRRALFQAPKKQQENILMAVGMSGMFGTMGDAMAGAMTGDRSAKIGDQVVGPIPAFLNQLQQNPLLAPIPNNAINLVKNLSPH